MAHPLDGFSLPSQSGGRISPSIGSSSFGNIDASSILSDVQARDNYAKKKKQSADMAVIKFDKAPSVTLHKSDLLNQFDKLNAPLRRRFIQQLQKNKDKDSQKAYDWLNSTGRLQGSKMDAIAGFNDKLGGGFGRGILRGVDAMLPGHNTFGLEGLANEWDKRVQAQDNTYTKSYKRGATAGSAAKGAVDLATLVVPGAATDKAVRGTKFIQTLEKGGKLAKTTGLVSRTLPGSLEASGISADQQKGQGNDVNLAQTLGTGAGIDLLFGATGGLYRGAKQAIRATHLDKVVGKEAKAILDKVGSAKDLADLYHSAIEARATGSRKLTKDEQNVIALVKNQKLNFGGNVNEAYKALAEGDTNTLRHAFDTRSKADKFVSSMFDTIGKGGYSQLKYSKVGQQLRRAFGDKMSPVYDAIDRADASFSEKQMLKELVDYGSGSVRRGVAANELLNVDPAGALMSDLHKKGFQNRHLYDDVSQYIAARHENTLMDKGVKPENAALRRQNDAVIGRYSQDQQKVLEGKYQNLKDTNAQWLTKMRDEGLITPDQFDELSQNPDYIRVQRQLASDAPEAITKGGGGMSMTDAGLIQKTGKSQNDMLDPLAVMQQRAHEIGQRIDKNRGANSILPELETLGTGSKLPDTKTVSSTAQYPQNVAGFLDQGMPKRWELPTDVAEAIKNQHIESMGKIQQLFGGPTKLFKTLTTGINPAFGGPNIARDVQSAGIYHSSDSHFVKAMGDSLGDSIGEAFGLKTSKEFQDYMKHEGNATFLNLQERSGLKQAKKKILNESKLSSGKKIRVIQANFFSSPVKGLETMANLSEQYTRYASYKAALDAAKKQGLSDVAAQRKAILAARNNSIDFFKGGTTSSALNTFIPYLNPAIQGSRKFAKEFHENPVTFARKIMTHVAAPAAIATAWNLQNEDTKKIYMDIPESEKEKNFLFVIPGMKKDGRGRYTVVKIPMPQQFSNMVQPIRRSMEAAAGLKPLEFNKIVTDILSPFSGVELDPGKALSQTVLGYPVVKATAQGLSNKDFYFNKDIVPGSLQDAPATEQYTKGTSGTAIAIGKALGLSPMKVEQFGRDLLGGGAPILFNTADQVQQKLGGKDTQGGGKSVPQAVMDRFSSATGGEVERQFYNVYGPASGLRDYRVKQIYKLIDQGKYKEAQRRAHDYNTEVDNRFSKYFHEYGAYLPKQLGNGASPTDMIDSLKIDVQVSKKGRPYIMR